MLNVPFKLILVVGDVAMVAVVIVLVGILMLVAVLLLVVEVVVGEISSILYCSLKMQFFLSFQQIYIVVRPLRGF